MEAIISSDLFCQFLKSAVKDLKEANVVNPTRSKKQYRVSFLGRVKGEDSQKAEVSHAQTFVGIPKVVWMQDYVLMFAVHNYALAMHTPQHTHTLCAGVRLVHSLVHTP